MVINPNDAKAFIYRALLLVYVGRRREALESLHNAFRLDPMFPDWVLDIAFLIYLGARNLEKALETAEKAPKQAWPELPGWLAVLYAHTGNLDQASKIAKTFTANVRRLWIGESIPDDAECVRWLFVDNPFRHQDDIDWLTEGFRKAGLEV